LLRQYLPKDSDLSGFAQVELDEIAWKLNTRPRKSPGYKCPAELFTPDAFDFKQHHAALFALGGLKPPSSRRKSWPMKAWTRNIAHEKSVADLEPVARRPAGSCPRNRTCRRRPAAASHHQSRPFDEAAPLQEAIVQGRRKSK
jgi:hypothetical protein